MQSLRSPLTAAFPPWDAAEAAAIAAGLSGLDGAALPILHALQDRFGHVPEAAVPIVAEALNLSRADVHGVVTFYHDFRRHPPGRHTVKMCRAEACQATGAVALAERAKRALEVDWHGTSADGAVTLEPVFCLGLCAIGPAALVDGEPAAFPDAAALDAVLAELRA